MLRILLLTSQGLHNLGGTEKIIYYFLSNFSNLYDIEVLSIKYNWGNRIKDFPLLDIFKNYKINRYILKDPFFFNVLNFLIKYIFKSDLDYAYKQIFNYFRNNQNIDLVIVINGILLNSINKVKQVLNLKFKIIYWDHVDIVNFYRIRKKNFVIQLIRDILRNEIESGIKKTEYHLCISSGIERIIKEINPQAKTYLVYNPVEIKEEELIDRGKENEFIYVGRLDDYQKNISFMLEGLSRLKKYKWKLRIIGKGPDEKKLKEISKKLGIEKRVIWEGFKENPYKDLKEVKALLLTSRYEGLPLVLIESNVRGIPFISSNCLSGPEDIVIEGVNGYLYQEGNIEDFVNKVEKVIKGELKFPNPQEIRKTAYRFEKNLIFSKISTILKDIYKG
jgi:UDP-D-galactose:(glucosyl)LPS alpha-1,6-D-galactosyltransferase